MAGKERGGLKHVGARRGTRVRTEREGRVTKKGNVCLWERRKRKSFIDDVERRTQEKRGEQQEKGGENSGKQADIGEVELAG
jgi:hypothetical protein